MLLKFYVLFFPDSEDEKQCRENMDYWIENACIVLDASRKM